MQSLKFNRLSFLILFLGFGILTSCNNDDDSDLLSILKSEDYDLKAKPGGFDGEVKFDKINDSETVITIELDGDNVTTPRPAHIHFNTAAESGDIAVTLGPVVNGKSEITVSKLDNGTPITYEELIEFDGYVNVHKSATELSTVVAQGDIGQNEIKGDEKTYSLEARNGISVSGTVLFQERANGTTLATFNLANTVAGEMHPAHIHLNSFAEGGAIAFTFNPVDGNTGSSVTQMEVFDGGGEFKFDDIEDYDGYINVHLSASDLAVVAQGDIGSNELEGTQETYTLNMLNASGVSGSITILERKNGNSLAVIALTGTPQGGMHPSHVHFGSVADAPGDIAITLTPVDGNTGLSYTNIEMQDAGVAIDFDDLEDFNGYVNIHLSASDLSVVAQGDFGSNAN